MGVQCSQFAVDFVLWEKLFNQYDDITTLVELGTLHGGFSLFLLLQCIQRGIEFSTFDIATQEQAKKLIDRGIMKSGSESNLGEFLSLDKYCNIGDIFEELKDTVVEKITADGRVLLFCDNGKKIKEIEMFSPYLKDGDLLVVHDWGTEFDARHLPENCASIMDECCDHVGSLTKFCIML